MLEVYSTGRIADIALIFIAIEWVALTFISIRFERGIAPQDMLPNLLSAAFLLLALRNNLDKGSWQWTAGFLAASFPAHLLDLHRRWNNPRRSRRPGSETGIAPGRGDR